MSADTDVSATAPDPDPAVQVPLSERLIRMPAVLPLLTFAAILLILEVGTRLFAVPSNILPAPSRIAGGFDSIGFGRWADMSGRHCAWR